MNILSRIEGHVRNKPDKIFSVVPSRSGDLIMTYGELWGEAQMYARLYAERGVESGSVVLIMLRGVESIYPAFVGAMLHGAIPSIMPYCTPKQDPTLFWSSHAALFDRIRPGAIVTFREYADFVAVAYRPAIRIFDDERSEAQERAEPVGIPHGSPIAFLQHSSGTTGLKKGVMLSHEAVLAQVDAYGPLTGLDDSAFVASWLPLYHDMGLIACFITPMLVGASVVQLDSIEWVAAPLALLDAVEKWNATHIWLPNFAFNHLVLSRRSKKRWDLSSLKAIIDCSEPCKLKSLHDFATCFADCGINRSTLQVCYAMAETVFAVTQTPLGEEVKGFPLSRALLASDHLAAPPRSEDDRQVVVSCGRLLPNMHVRIVDGNGAAVPEGVVGEVTVSSASLYSGYNKMPEMTAVRLRDGWHHTGDLGFVSVDELYLTGRKDDLLIVRGRNFYAHEIEDAMNRVQGVYPGRVVAFAIPSEASGTAEVICLAETRADADQTALRRELRTVIERDVGVTAGRVIFVASGALVKTTSGKISREANQWRYAQGLFQPPGSPGSAASSDG